MGVPTKRLKVTGVFGSYGEDGATFTPSLDVDGNLSWTNDKGLENPPTVNIKGLIGDQGEPGPQGTSILYYSEETACSGIASMRLETTITSGWPKFSATPKTDDLVISASGQLFEITSVTDTELTMVYKIDLKGKDGSGGSGETVTDEHINSLIDAKLGVIENGTY